MKKRYYIFLIVLFSIKQVNAQSYVAIPDSNFVHYLKTIVPSAFKGDSLNKNSTLVTTITKTINAPSHNISNLNGIQYFTSLDTLVSDFNLLTSFPILPNTLTYLSSCCNSLTSVPTLSNGLTYLDVNNNSSITSLPTLPTSLSTLGCSYNSITSLPTLPNSLTYLQCDHNSISCLPTFPNSIATIYIDPNPYNCLPNYIAAMSATDLAKPLCAAGNTNGCPVSIAGIEQYNTNSIISIFPNPSSGNITITGSNNMDEVKVIDMLGQIVYEAKPNAANTTLTLNNAGVYFITITTGAETSTKKVIVNK